MGDDGRELEHYSVESALRHRAKAQTDGASRIAYETVAYRYLDSALTQIETLRAQLAAEREAVDAMLDLASICAGRLRFSSSRVERERSDKLHAAVAAVRKARRT